jgi:hypothetical protein
MTQVMTQVEALQQLEKISDEGNHTIITIPRFGIINIRDAISAVIDCCDFFGEEDTPAPVEVTIDSITFENCEPWIVYREPKQNYRYAKEIGI